MIRIDVGELSAIDLSQEAAVCESNGEYCEAYRIDTGKAEFAELLWCPNSGRAGIAWGADADWTDAESAADALWRWENDALSN